MRRRLAEVAQYAGVSEATVSRVLNQRPGVAKQTQELVLTALDVLGYERPTGLRGARARLVGLVLPELQNPIFPAFAEVVADALAKRGFTPVLCTRTSAGISEAAYVDMLLEHQVSGVIFSGGLYAQASADHEHYQRLRERGLPAVLVNAAYEPDNLDVRAYRKVEPVVVHRYSAGAELIVSRVRIDRDSVRVAFVQVPTADPNDDPATSLTIRWPVPFNKTFSESLLVDNLIRQFVEVKPTQTQ